MLRFENVTVSFDGEVALRDISFEAYEGESRIILGAAGSGKTVLLKTALGLTQAGFRQGLCVRPGHLHHAGETAVRYPQQDRHAVPGKRAVRFAEHRRKRGVSAAQSAIDQVSAKDEVLPRVKQTLEFVELGGTLAKFPSELSGGMRRRAAIARAVVTEPPLLMYDSPTAGLDPITAHTIMALLIKERDVSQTTTLMVTHRYQDGNLMANFRYNSEQGALEPARNGDRQKSRTTFMVLKEGRLIFESDQDAIESSNDPYISKFVKQRV